jgi:hypothetical protein
VDITVLRSLFERPEGVAVRWFVSFQENRFGRLLAHSCNLLGGGLGFEPLFAGERNRHFIFERRLLVRLAHLESHIGKPPRRPRIPPHSEIGARHPYILRWRTDCPGQNFGFE